MSAVYAIVCIFTQWIRTKRKKPEKTRFCAWYGSPKRQKKEWNISVIRHSVRKRKKSFAFGCRFWWFFISGVYREQSRKITYVHEDKMMYDFLSHLNESPHMIHSFIQIHTFSRRLPSKNMCIFPFLLRCCCCVTQTHALYPWCWAFREQRKKNTISVQSYKVSAINDKHKIVVDFFILFLNAVSTCCWCHSLMNILC